MGGAGGEAEKVWVKGHGRDGRQKAESIRGPKEARRSVAEGAPKFCVKCLKRGGAKRKGRAAHFGGYLETLHSRENVCTSTA